MLTFLSTGGSSLDAYVVRGGDEGVYSPKLHAALEELGTWSAEARQVLALAAKLHLRLNEELLGLSDVHDLQALRFALCERLGERRAA